MEKLLKILTRFMIKPMLSANAPLWLQRFAGVASSLILKGAPNCDLSKTTLGGRPTLRIKSHKAQGKRTVLYLHGGAYVMGGFSSHAKFASWIAHTLDAEVCLPDYHLSPEYVFPAARDEALACYKELLESGVDPTELIIAGDSAGGGLALSTAVAIRDAGLPLPAALILLSPWVDLTLSGSTILSHVKRDDMVSTGWLKFGAAAYVGNNSVIHPGCSPLFADLAGLPPMLIQVGSEEILLDDSRRLAYKAENAGIDISLEIYPNMGHIFQVTAGHSVTANRALDAIAVFCDDLLNVQMSSYK